MRPRLPQPPPTCLFPQGKYLAVLSLSVRTRIATRCGEGCRGDGTTGYHPQKSLSLAESRGARATTPPFGIMIPAKLLADVPIC